MKRIFPEQYSDQSAGQKLLSFLVYLLGAVIFFGGIYLVTLDLIFWGVLLVLVGVVLIVARLKLL